MKHELERLINECVGTLKICREVDPFNSLGLAMFAKDIQIANKMLEEGSDDDIKNSIDCLKKWLN